jgi:hypothetical protein
MNAIRWASLLAALTLSGCATVEPPTPITGPKLVLADSAEPKSGSMAHIYSVTQVNGRRIEDSGRATSVATHGRGMALQLKVLDRELAAGPVRLKLEGATQYAAPIQAMLGKTCRAEGEVQLSLQADQRYVVKGKLDATSCEVWIEDANGQQVAGSRVSGAGLK